MRPVRILLLLFLVPLVALAQTSYDHYNDAYFTGDGSLPNLVEANGLGAKSSFGLPLPGDTENEPVEDTTEEPSPGAKESQLPAETPAPQTPAENKQAPSVVVENEEDVIDLLLGSGAISGVESLPGTGGVVDFSSYGSSGFRIVVDGKKVRDLFGNSVSVKEVLQLWRTSSERQKRGKSITTGQYYALIAATLAEDDTRLDRAEFTDVYLELTYQSRGALLWVVPWAFPVRVTIQMDAQAEERVSVKFPWYHWFVREYFSRDSLAAEVRDLVAAEEALASDGETLQIRLFVALTNFLKQKVRTISDSVILGN